MKPCIFGVGSRHGGDDAVGLVVADHLRVSRQAREGEVEVRLVDDPSDIAMHAAPGRALIIVDAVVGASPGNVRVLSVTELQEREGAVSSHGFGVSHALRLAAALHGERLRTGIVAIEIARPNASTSALSPAVAMAVEQAASVALKLAREL